MNLGEHKRPSLLMAALKPDDFNIFGRNLSTYFSLCVRVCAYEKRDLVTNVATNYRTRHRYASVGIVSPYHFQCLEDAQKRRIEDAIRLNQHDDMAHLDRKQQHLRKLCANVRVKGAHIIR